jgi:denticleless
MPSETPVGWRACGNLAMSESPARIGLSMDPYTPIRSADAIDGRVANPTSTSGAGVATEAETETLFDHVISRQRVTRRVGWWKAAPETQAVWSAGAPPYTRILNGLTCGPENGQGKGTILCDSLGVNTSPVFVMKFSSGRVRYRNMVALGDEDGFVSIIRATDTIPSSLGDPSAPNRPIGQWRAHRNAVFDLAWANEDRWMYCAAGDTRLSLWDTGYARCISRFHAGCASIKTLSVKTDNHNVFSSAGRDGNIYIHDVRVMEAGGSSVADGTAAEDDTLHRPVLKLEGPHSIVASTPGKTPKTPKFGYARSGVTSLCFLDRSNSSVLASGGQDGRIKLWDLRYTDDPVLTHQPLADQMETLSDALCEANQGRSIHNLASMRQPPLSQRARGVTSLSLHPDGTRLLASYIGGHHLIYNVVHPDHGPCQWFGGNLIDSFYVKSAFSPDGTHIISGSSDSNAYIFSLQDKQGTNPIVLRGHAREVTAVAWNPYDQCQIMTAGDDHVAKFWRVDTSLTQEKEIPQPYDPCVMLQERLKYEQTRRTSGLASAPVSALSSSSPPAHPPGDSENDTRTPLRVRNILREGSGRPAKRKMAKQLTISEALLNRRRVME